MKKIALWIAAQLYAVCLMAQSTAITDSLTKLLATAGTDTTKAMLLYQLGDEWSSQDTAKALPYLQKGLHLSEKYPFYQGIGYFYLGRIRMDYDRPKALEAFDSAISFFELYPTQISWLYQSRSWSNKAVIAQWNGDNKQFIEWMLNKTIPLAAKAGDSIRIAEGYTNVALPFMNLEDNNKTIYYLNKSISIFRRVAPADLRQVDNYTNLARIYMRINDLPAAKNCLDSGAHLLAGHAQSLYAPYYYTTEGMYYIKRKDWDKAEVSIDKGLAVAETLKSRHDVHMLLYQKARLYDYRHDPAAVKKILLKLLNEGYATLDQDKKQIFHDLAYIESELGNKSAAYDWMTRYSNLADSIYEKETRLKITDLETRYNYVQQEKELLLATGKAKNQRLIMWASIVGLLGAVIFFLILYRLHKAKAKQALQSLQQQQQIDVARALLAGEEKERIRLARDLHDGLGGMLAGVKINLTHALQDNTSAEIDRVIGQLDNSVTELRRIARNMTPKALLHAGLEMALTELCASATNDRLHIYYKFMNLRRDISMPVQLIIYRIAQELLANVVKHSAATEAFLQCSQDEHTLYLTIEDNGRGYLQKDQSTGKGQGLENIRSRVDFLKGKMDISGGPGKGTIVNIELNTDEKR